MPAEWTSDRQGVVDLEERLSPADRARVEAHLAWCGDCLSYVQQFRQTIRLLGRLREESLSAEATDALAAAFRGWLRPLNPSL